MEKNIVYNLDCIDGLKLLPDNSIDSIVTDAPYEIGFMGKKWDSTGIAYDVDMWKECFRVLKHGGHLLAFGGCYDEETEYLTKDGWKLIKDATKDDLVATLNPDTHEIEYHNPMEIVKIHHHGDMYHFKTNKIDLLVTDNHKMYVSTLGNKGAKYRLQRADECHNKAIKMKKNAINTNADVDYFILPQTAQSNGHYTLTIAEKKIKMDEWLMFFGLWMAQGSASIVKVRTGFNYKTQICHFVEKDNEQIKDVMTNYFDTCEYVDSGKLVINNKQLAEYLNQFGHAHNKFVPDFIKQLSSRQINIFLEWYLRGDGDRNTKRKRAYTTSKQLSDDLQELALLSGISADISIQNKNGGYIKGRKINSNYPQYSICFNTVQNEPEIYQRNKQKEVVEVISNWNNYVYCVEVTNHIIYVRRNGKSAWCGNTRTYHRMACAIEDAGFEIRDQIQWIYGSGFPKSHDISKAIDKKFGAERKIIDTRKRGQTRPNSGGTGKGNGDIQGGYNFSENFDVTAPATDLAEQWDGWGTALKPAHEPIVMARKPLSEKTVVDNVLKWGTGGINIDESRIDLNGDYKAKANGRPSLTGHGDNYNPETANQADDVGRFPSNVILGCYCGKMKLKEDTPLEIKIKILEYFG